MQDNSSAILQLPLDLLSVTLNQDLGVSVVVSGYIIFVIVAALIIYLLGKLLLDWGRRKPDFEVSELTLGIGKNKYKLKPNEVDRQIAYKIWVELSTRKIGLPIDLEDDVVVEVYNSWYAFFGITRELIKEVPVSKFKRKDTEKIVDLSIKVLNEGVRPHLTQWQARFHKWYEIELEDKKNASLAPQDIQKKYSEFDKLKENMAEINEHLIAYRDLMHKLISND